MTVAAQIYRSIVEKLERHQEFIVVSIIGKKGSIPAELGSKMIINPDHSSEGTIGGGELEHYILSQAANLFEQKRTFIEKYSLDGTKPLQMNCGGELTLFFEYHPCLEKLFIFGYGHVAKELQLFLERLEWNFTVIDHRNFNPSPPFLISSVNYPDFIKSHHFPENSYYLVMTPSHQFDYQVLESLLNRGVMPRYIGLLASVRKTREIFEKLEHSLGKQADLSKIYAPVGLNLGGKKLSEIALSIVSQLQLIRSGKIEPSHLKNTYENTANRNLQ